MDGFPSRRSVAIWLCLSLAPPVGALNLSADQGPSTQAQPMLDDVELRAVHFVDAEHGWAVGDRGVIWRTDDGGRSWQLAPSDVDCTLATVHFIDPTNGWAAGGQRRPYLRSTVGVLLRTADGGRTWEADKGHLLPAIKKLKFFGPTQGWAVAEPSAIFPLSVFFTSDGGRAWTPLADREAQTWTVADFADPLCAALAGPRSAAARCASESWNIGSSANSACAKRGPCGWPVRARVGWRAMADCCWSRTMAEARGNRRRRFPRRPSNLTGGRSRSMASTSGLQARLARGSRTPPTAAEHGIAWPLAKICRFALAFVDERHGWAVGALGTILATSDGGQTWTRQRGSRSRAALLALYSDDDRVPLEALARLAASDGYITAVDVLVRRDAEPDTEAAASSADRERMAFVAVGSSATEQAWGFPLRQRGIPIAVEQIVDGWNRLYAGHGVDRLEEHLVRALRTWRPDVVLTSAASPGGDDPLGHLVNQVVLRAVADAADPEKFAEHITGMGLNTWSVKKVAGSLPEGKPGTINVNTSQLAPRLSRSLADYSARRGLLRERYSPPLNAWGFRLYHDSIPQGLGRQEFFSGITLQPHSDARREVPNGGRGSVDAMRQIAEKHRNLQAILRIPSAPDAAGRFFSVRSAI